MEEKKLLIVGIDPGTTMAYAVLDIEGNLLHLNSSKQLDLNQLISRTVELGKVVLVGTDKVKIPHLIEAFATKLGAKIVSPEEDIRVDEKRKMINGFNFSNEHQGDALASALFAYKETRVLLDKIDIFVRDNKKYDIKNRIKELVITKKISIKNATNLLEKKEEELQIMERVLVEKKLNENDFLKLYNKLKKYEAEIKFIKKYNNTLKNTIKNLEKQIKIKPRDTNKKDFREDRIKFFENLVKSKENEIENLKLLMKSYNRIISNIDNFYILKKLDTLGKNEFGFKNKILNIQRNDILLVDNPDIISHNVVDLLKNKVFVVVYKKLINKKTENLPFIFINAKNLRIEEDRYFGFVEKRQFEIEKNKVDWFKKVIDDYKREKEQLID